MKIKQIACALLLSGCAIAGPVTNAAAWQMKQAPLMTPWAGQVDISCPLPEYPRPQLVRNDGWLNLNGVWELRKGVPGEAYSAKFGYDKSILVPYPIESALSGVMEKSDEQAYWYRRSFTVPKEMRGKRLMLNFGAVDWECRVYVNGREVGGHAGGYDPFSIDITDAIKGKGEQELAVYIYDNTGTQGQMVGKQNKKPEGCVYTASSGIWQTVWLEAVPKNHITNIEMEPTLSQNMLNIVANANDAATTVDVSVKDRDGKEVATLKDGKTGSNLRLSIPDAHLWSPDDPYLYDVDITLRKNGKVADKVRSYFGMRGIEVKKVGEYQRIFLNGEQIFQVGPLDQGFWPDGLHTPPSEEAMLFDIRTTKDLGFNMTRKHIKAEPDRWYYLCDREGLLVWQDLPCGQVLESMEDECKTRFKDNAVRIVKALKNHPSIVQWVVFNEGWGQFDTEEVTALVDSNVNRLSPKEDGKTSLICCASGWNDVETGDIIDSHSYPRPSCPTSPSRAAVNGEMGGITLKVDGHIWPGGEFQYTNVSDKAAFTDYFLNLCDEVTNLYFLGLNAAVYTQITDVEIEKNGFLTYDRKVLKTDEPAKVRARLAELIGMPKGQLLIKPIISAGNKHHYNWRYTVEADVPDNWHALDFDDTAWATGPAAFGQNMGSADSYIGTKWTTNDITARRWYKLGDISPENIDKLHLVLFHDDDVEVYINGILAARRGGYTTGYVPVKISDEAKAALKPGDWNLVAVKVHQGYGGQMMDFGISAFTDADFDYTEDFSDRER